MQKLKIILSLFFTMYITSVSACRYTIREIGFSTLSKVTYVIYRVDENSSFFPKQQALSFSESNVKPFGLNFSTNKTNEVVKFVNSQKLSFPAYVLVDQDGRMLVVSDKVNVNSGILSSPIQKQLLANLPLNYASVILIEGINATSNDIAKQSILGACSRINNIMPNMPKQVDVGPDMVTISNNQFEQEKVLLWSLGVEAIPKEPIAFILYGKGRMMGEKINFQDIEKNNVYKLLSIIGADCECGLDRKWMLGYQIPLDWPKKTRQDLSDRLGFDVDNPMVLTEMSRILAIENRVPKDPDGISFEPVVIDLEDEFDDIPEVDHSVNVKEEDEEEEASDSNSNVILYSLLFFLLIISVGTYFVIKK